MKRTRRNHGAAFKAQVAFAACKGDKTLAELATQFGVHLTQIKEWSSTCWRGPSTCLAAQIHRVLLKLWGETPSRFAHHIPPSGDYAWKVSTKSGEDHSQSDGVRDTGWISVTWGQSNRQ